MVSTIRLFGWLASGMANVLLYGTLLALWPTLGECALRLCVTGHPGFWVAIDTWRPFIDNPGPGSAAGREPQCPAPEATGDAYDLVAAPLPDGYDPHAHGGRAIYACVLVGADGEVLRARMLRGTGEPGGDATLIHTIRRSWSFRTTYQAELAPSWQRVRLDSGPVDGAVWDPPMLY
ncbi:MAG TPA: hypothetical protein VEA61_16260 [Allosphingosinicella sp.]|nr:hypothetical protein [Allosphingosinicella sp.]